MNRAGGRVACVLAVLFLQGCVPAIINEVDVPQLRGVVVEGEGGTPVSGAEVRVIRPDGAEVARVESDSDGRFLIPGQTTRRFKLLMPGHALIRLPVEAHHPEYAAPAHSVGFMPTTARAGSTVQQEPGIVLVLLPTSAFSGIPDREVCPAEDRFVYALVLAEALPTLRNQPAFQRQVLSNERMVSNLQDGLLHMLAERHSQCRALDGIEERRDNLDSGGWG